MTGDSNKPDKQASDDTEELIYEHVKDAPQQQMEVADKLDDKMLRIFAAASIIIGLLGLSSIGNLGWRSLFFVLPLIPYAFTAFWTFRHINPDSFHWGLRAHQLPTKWKDSAREVRRALINDIGEAYSENEPILKDKAWYIRASLVATSIEVGLVMVALILYRLF